MAGTIARLAFLIAFVRMSASAQNIRFPCIEPEEIQNFNLSEVYARSGAGAGDFFLFKRLLELTPGRPKPGTLAPLFDQKPKDHPDDPRYLYLDGRALMGKNTREAIRRQLSRAAEIAPDFPWTYTALATIYES